MAEETFRLTIDDAGAFKALDDLEKKLVETGETGEDAAKGIGEAFDFARGFVEGMTEELQTASKQIADQQQTIQKTKKENDAWGKSVKDLIGNFNVGGQSLAQWAQQVRGFAGVVQSGAVATEGASKAMRIFSTVLKATGIGLIISAVAALIGYFTRFQSGVDKVNRVLAATGAVFDRLITGLTNFGSAIVKVFQGDFSGALDSAKQGLYDVSVGLADAAVNAYNLEAAFQALRDTTIAVSIENAKNRVELEKQKAIAEDATRTFRERIAAQQQAGRIDKETAEVNLALATQELSLAKQKLLQNKDNAESIKAEQEASLKFADALIDRNAAITNAEKGLRDLRKEASDAAKKQAEERAKRLEDERKALEALAKDLQKLRLAALGEGLDAELFVVNQKFDELAKTAQAGVDKLNEIEGRRGLSPQEIAQRAEFQALAVQIEEQRLGALLDVIAEFNEKELAIEAEQEERKKALAEKDLDRALKSLENEKKLRDEQINLQEAQNERFLKELAAKGVDEEKIKAAQLELDTFIQAERLNNEIQFQEALLSLTDKGNTEQIAQIEATIATLKQKLGNLQVDGPKVKPRSLFELLGIDEDGEEAIKEAVGQIVAGINQIAQARIDAAAAQVSAIDELINKQEEAINREAELAKAGLANDLSLEKERLAELKKQRDAAAKEEAKARKAQIVLDTIQQTVSLVTASANIFKSVSGLGPFGIPLAIGLIAAMFGAFVAARARALKAAEVPKFRKGVKLSGLPHEQEGIKMVDHRGQVVGEAEGDEWLIGAGPSREHDRFLNRLNKGEFKGVDLNDMMRASSRKQNPASGAGERISDMERRKADVSSAQHWQAMKSAYMEGSREIVRAINEKPEIAPWKGGYKKTVKRGSVTETKTVVPSEK